MKISSNLKVFFFRIGLVFIFYMLSRWLFVFFNNDIFNLGSFSELLRLSFYGIKFDLAAIIYMLSIFIILSFLPGNNFFNYRYKKLTRFFYFFGSLIGLGLNFIDFAYYRFNLMRINATVLEVIQNEQNKVKLTYHFFIEYFHLVFLFFLFSFVWIYLYNLFDIKKQEIKPSFSYWIKSIILFFVVIVICIAGVRGDLKKSTRPITLIHAMENLNNPKKADIILNSTFTVIRTIGKNSFKKTNIYSEDEIKKVIKPIKFYHKNDTIKPNIILFILESMGREYWGSLNQKNNIDNFISYTPFLDSLSRESLIFPNFYANSRKSIHGMPAILAGIPSFETAYTSSAYSNQPVESVVSIANKMGYNTSFFHGAPNGSMGFLGFSKILGFNNYYGKDEYNNDSDYDGYWGIWDLPFLKFTKEVIDQKSEPFFSTIFTVTSHEPYVIPDEFEEYFDEGNIPMHKAVRYTDYSLSQFFEIAKNENWFNNTIFIFTADHGNQTYYSFYEKMINRFANPLIIYSPGSNLKGVSYQLSQHLDIYPTIVDLINYNKPFRSWGQSLLSGIEDDSFVVNYFGAGNYFYMDNDYILVSDGSKVNGFYDSKDFDLSNNLMEQSNIKLSYLEYKFNLFLQDYMTRIIDKKMNNE
jgi:phosphoglycerol transferase MdoB-like AlkP superfamily enzyme